LVIDLPALHQDHWQRLGVPRETPLHWGPTSTGEVQELSGLSWPIRSCLTTAEGWYDESQGQRHSFVPVRKGLCLQRNVSSVAMRAGGFLAIIAGIGCRQAAWLLAVLFHGRVGTSSVDRWIDTVAADLPKPLLERLKRLGLRLTTFSIDHSQALRNAITAVGPEARIQYDSFQSIQNIWKKRWSDAVAHRREVEARSQRVHTAWYRANLEALAQTLWTKRSLLCTSDERMPPEEHQQVVAIMEADPKVGTLRTFLHGVWPLFRDSQDARDAREALEARKKITIDPTAHSTIHEVLACLEDHFEQMITSLKHDDVQRNSLAESGMRVLRRLEVGPDGFRTPTGRENCLRISQAAQYLGWSVHNPPTTMILVPRNMLERQEPGVTLSPGTGPPNGPCQAIATAVG
jgi:hypothetical protein